MREVSSYSSTGAVCLDGTLVETEKLEALSYARAATGLRSDLNEADVVEGFEDPVGRSRQEVATALVRRLGLEEAAHLDPNPFVSNPESDGAASG